MQSCPVGNAGLKVMQLTVLATRGSVLFASGERTGTALGEMRNV